MLWTVGLCLYGLVIGSVVHGIGDEIGGSSVAHDIVARMGGTGALEQAFIAVAFAMLGMVAAAFAISLTLRLHQEESEPTSRDGAGRRGVANPLAGKPFGDRARRVGGGDAGRGVVAGLVYGAAAGDVGGKLPTVVGNRGRPTARGLAAVGRDGRACSALRRG